MSMDRGRITAVPIVSVSRIAAPNHRVVEVSLDNGAVLEVSPRHPTVEGGRFGDLRPGQELGGRRVVAVRTIPFVHSHTHDILPASDSGAYVVGGALVASTLTAKSRAVALAETFPLAAGRVLPSASLHP